MIVAVGVMFLYGLVMMGCFIGMIHYAVKWVTYDETEVDKRESTKSR